MTRIVLMLGAVLTTALATLTWQEPPLSDSRLSVNPLVREDIFAGFLEDDMERFSKGERNIDKLLEQRPDEKPVLLAWKGGATLYRAVRALEDERNDAFLEEYQRALDLFAEARRLGPNDQGVDAVTGGCYVVFADRLPEEKQAAAWSEAYDAYRRLWKKQEAAVPKLPTHLRGELLGGLAQSAQRTGQDAEARQYVEKILAVLPDTPYETVARKWKEEPAVASRSSLTCLTCHAQGRLAERRAELEAESKPSQRP